MRILIAPDAFKGSLSAAQAAEAIASGIRDTIPNADIETLPMADGGEGTLGALTPHVLHKKYHVIDDEYLIYSHEDRHGTVLIESAHWLGLTRPAMQSLDIQQRGSGALGEGMRRHLDAGLRRFVIGLGGSATNDGGLGMLMALGLKASDAQGRAVSPDLHGLTKLAALDASDLDARLADCDLTILCDVDAPLCGQAGATCNFGPQKGLPVDQLPIVDRTMAGFANLAEAAFGRTAREMPGSGAAGGLGFALALLGGRLVSGADYVIEKAGLAGKMTGCGWVVTGEGRSDAQTLQGKLPFKVAEMARAADVKIALISGDVTEPSMLADVFDAVVPARPQGMAVEKAMEQAALLLRRAACAWAEKIAG